MSEENEQTGPRTPIASGDSTGRAALDGTNRGPFADLRRRIYLTYRYHGWRALLFRALTLPLRFTPLKHRLRLRSNPDIDAYRRALAWYGRNARPSTS